MAVLDRLTELNDTELGNVVAVAAQILAESAGGDADAESAEEISPLAASRQVATTLAANGTAVSASDVQQALEDETTSREIALTVLGELARVPELAAELERRVAERERKLSAPELLLATAALLVLAIKIKDIRIVQREARGTTYNETTIRFFEATEVLKNAIDDIIARVIRP